MNVQVFSARRITSRAVRRIIGRGALAAFITGLGAISVSAYGADLETAYSRAVALPSSSAMTGRRSIPAPTRPYDPHVAKSNGNARAELVDQLYDELMRSSGCSLVSSHPSIRGGC